MPNAYYIHYLLDDNSRINALREGVITPELAAAMPTEYHLDSLLNNASSIKALREKLITPEQIAQIEYSKDIHRYIENKIQQSELKSTPSKKF